MINVHYALHLNRANATARRVDKVEDCESMLIQVIRCLLHAFAVDLTLNSDVLLIWIVLQKIKELCT